mmetsp:Transcript_32369/g.64966  ORF Transcript_32369/g.64966 Transcript_32369/m.64966 type:complete len:97 (-) Transcript_32369:186-476(-)
MLGFLEQEEFEFFTTAARKVLLGFTSGHEESKSTCGLHRCSILQHKMGHQLRRLRASSGNHPDPPLFRIIWRDRKEGTLSEGERSKSFSKGLSLSL